MPRGAKDYSNVKAYGPMSRLDDHAELAVRLGSPDSFERSGRVIYIDDFSKGKPQWSSAGYGTGSRFQLSPLRALSPPFSLEMRTGGDGAHGIKTTLELPYHTLYKLGLEYAFTHTTQSLYHYFEIIHYDGDNKHLFLVVFDIQGDTLMVRDHNGDYWTFGTDVGAQTDAWLFHRAKLIVDTETGEYVRFIHNDEVYELDDYSPLVQVADTVPHLEVVVQFTGDEGSNREHYVDDVIVTQAED